MVSSTIHIQKRFQEISKSIHDKNFWKFWNNHKGKVSNSVLVGITSLQHWKLITGVMHRLECLKGTEKFLSSKVQDIYLKTQISVWPYLSFV